MKIFFKQLKQILIKLKFTIPKRRDYLIFDKVNYEYIENYIGKNSFNILEFRDYKLNFFAILYSLLFFYRSEIKVEYIRFYLNFSKKKTIISFNYNRLVLFRIKKYYPDIKIIVIQNGLANNYFLNNLKKNEFDYSADHFFCISNIEANIFKKKIKSNYEVIGSVKNNYYYKSKKIKKREVIFISQFRNKNINFRSRPFFSTYSYTQKLLFPILVNFCKKNNLSLSILGSSYEKNQEIKYYNELIKGISFRYYKRENKLSYKRVENALFGVGVESTLIYEMLSRGNKVAIFNFGLKKSNAIKDEVFISKFGFKDQGKFWLKKFDKIKVVKILQYLLNVSNERWNQDNLSYKKIIPFNKMNIRLKQVLNN